MSAPSSMMTGDLPPSSSVTVARCFAAAAITTRPTRVLPVKKMWLKGRSSRASATETSPSKHATSRSSKASRMISPAMRAVAGHRSVSLTMQQLPAAMAAASGPSTRPSGKFHGPRIRQTPRASWMICARSSGLSEGVTSTGAIQASRLSMLRWMLPSTFSTSVTRISFTGLRVSSSTAAMIASVRDSTAALSLARLALRASAPEAFTSHWWACCRAKTRASSSGAGFTVWAGRDMIFSDPVLVVCQGATRGFYHPVTRPSARGQPWPEGQGHHRGDEWRNEKGRGRPRPFPSILSKGWSIRPGLSRPVRYHSPPWPVSVLAGLMALRKFSACM